MVAFSTPVKLNHFQIFQKRNGELGEMVKKLSIDTLKKDGVRIKFYDCYKQSIRLAILIANLKK